MDTSNRVSKTTGCHAYSDYILIICLSTGILTKPDLVDKGTEGTVVDIVHNEVVHLTKGYMIVRCRGQKEIIDKVTINEATVTEQSFFKDHSHFR